MKNEIIDKFNFFSSDLTLSPWNRVKELFITFIKSLPMTLSSRSSVKYLGATKLNNWYEPSIPNRKEKDPIITWIGHSSFLIQLENYNILIDPIFNDLMFLYKRNCAPGIALKDLPKIDFILISHDHADHMNYKTLLQLKKYNSTILIPKGLRSWFDANGFKNVIEKKWWEEEIFNFDDNNLKFTFLPALHWSGRSVTKINKSVWGSWMISSASKNIYFAGDTAYAKHFSQIAKKFNNIDIALMPIGPCKPRQFVKYSHLDAEEAVQAFIDLGAKKFIPMHWGTFKMNMDNFNDPINMLNNSWNKFSLLLKNKKLNVLKFGQSFKV